MDIVLYLLYTRRCRTRACRIMRDTHHPINGLFNLLQSGRLLCCHTTRIERLNWASSNRNINSHPTSAPIKFAQTHSLTLTIITKCLTVHCIHASIAYTSFLSFCFILNFFSFFKLNPLVSLLVVPLEKLFFTVHSFLLTSY